MEISRIFPEETLKNLSYMFARHKGVYQEKSYNSIHSEPQHCIEVSSLLHAPPAIPLGKTPQ
jgi:hypothetical protein